MFTDPTRQPPMSGRQLLRQNVFERLHADIITGSLEPGRRLRDDELTALLGVSRTPLREALARLDELGLVHTSPNRFTRVAPLASAALFESLDILRALSPLATGQLVAALDDDALLEAGYLAQRIRRLTMQESARAVALVLRFAEQLLSSVELLPALVTSTMTRAVRYTAQRPLVLQNAGGVEAVVQIVQALLERDADAMHRSIVDYLDRIEHAIREQWNPLDLEYPADNEESPR